MMPSPQIMAATLARRTQDVAILLLGQSIALYNPPTRIAEEMVMLDVWRTREAYAHDNRYAL